MAEKSISHEGVVEEMDEKGIRVKISGLAACSECQARGACSVSEGKEKYLTVPLNGSSYTEGDRVHVTISQSLGFMALFLGYGIPFLLVLTLLLIMSGVSDNELANGLVSLGSLLPYYVVLRLFRSRIDRQFLFTLTKT
jgi:sigma-E factor negative regulatory protein RseC